MNPWLSIELVTNNPDFWIIINSPGNNTKYDPMKTIVFQMEPNMDKNQAVWGEWAHPNPDKFYKVCLHSDYVNPIEWHLSKTYKQILTEPVVKKHGDVISAIMSDRYHDEGQMLRIQFLKHMDTKNVIPIHVFGSNKFCYNNYKGSLPYHCKDDGLFPFKYTFAAENNSIYNYVTEKLVDAILAECLCFYWGCPNIDEIIDPQAYIVLPLDNFEKAYEIVRKAVSNNEWEKRLDIIRTEKKRIVEELQFFPFIEKIIHI